MYCCNILIYKLFYNYNNFVDMTLKEDWKEMLLLKMDSKCENNDDTNDIIYTDNTYPGTPKNAELSECSGSNSSLVSFISTPLVIDEVQWTQKKTWFFIEERFKRESKFQNPKSNVDKYWNEILQIMISNGYMECKEKGIHGLKTKFKNLMVTYRRNADKRRNKTGESSVKWPYFDRFDEVYGEKKNLNPPNTHLGSTLTATRKRKREEEAKLTSAENKENEDEQDTINVIDTQFINDMANTSSSDNENNTVRIKNKRLSANEKMVEILDKSLQAKINQWQEKKTLKEQQNKALMYVGDCIKSLRDANTK